MVIDHHASNVGFGAVDWLYPLAAATCEMVALLLPRLGLPMDAASGAIAEDPMAGVVGDTAMFQHPNATPRTLRVASELVAAGAPLSDIARLLYRTKPNTQLRLFGSVLSRLETAVDGRLVWATPEPGDLAAAGAAPEESEVSSTCWPSPALPRSPSCSGQMGDRTRISTRTREGGVDAIVLTAAFGGEGTREQPGLP